MKSDLDFFKLCWIELKEFLIGIVDEGSGDYPEALDYLTLMNLIEGKHSDLDE